MPSKKFSIATAIANLCAYASVHFSADRYDLIYARNQLLSMFGQGEPSEPDKELPDFQTGIIDPIVNYAIENGMCLPEEALLFETKIIGMVMPSPSSVIHRFDTIAANEGIKSATDYLNGLSVKSNYIRMPDISKNIKWTAPGPKGDLTITINLAKPEKDNKQLLLESKLPQTSYPKCKLCVENVGYPGALNYPPRQTLRVIPVYLNDEPWYFQFSPYVYFDNHCIALSEEHRPMAITPATFTRLLDFVDLFPHYFIGSNSDLPIVGGSILAHDHFQGGSKVLPMLTRPAKKVFRSEAFPEVTITIHDWYNSVISLTSHNRKELEKIAAYILHNWRNYSDESIGIFAKTSEQHNTITPIAEYGEAGYTLHLILRNNRTDETHPHGIFHPTEDMHNIKKEGIGLIEAMGIFILPGRLLDESRGVVEILTGRAPLNFAALSDETNPLSKHLSMIAQLANDYGTNLSDEEADRAVVNYINNTCIKILECTAVFKDTPEGNKAFDVYLKKMNFKQV
ncbi:MAG: UDP-glucose--hexose-1-phosphate uridylyltransferase [Clostridiales bacterium]|jgi:UDPglucose--hexose-1-phosphate uridylyltransferase|nr:UDP-glucose--hexose-1-phosphate uridylyltransferase [Clostridiales bacterium]HOB63904.1 UDP-glucose--hexose-1-phosphate uridylyltransferase [Clostridia bacterium]